MKTCKEYREQAWNALQIRWNEAALTMLIITIIALAFNTPSALTNYLHCAPYLTLSLGGLCTVVSILLIAPLQWANENAILDVSREHNIPVFATTWNNFKREFGTIVPAYLLVSIIVGLIALPTLFIGAIIFGLAYSMVPFIIHDNPEIGVTDALKASRLMTRGHKGDLFVLYLSFIGWFLLGIITCGIAFFWIKPYIYAAGAAFYEDIKAENETVTETENVN